MRRAESASTPGSDSASRIGRLLVVLVMTVCRAPRTVLGVSLVLCILSIYLACTRLDYRTRRDDLISSNKEHQSRWQNYLREFGNDEDVIVIVEGDDRAEMKATLETLAGKIRRRTDHFDRLFYKVDLRRLQDRALLYLSRDEIQGVEDKLEPMAPLLTHRDTWRHFGVSAALSQAEQILDRHSLGQSLSVEDRNALRQVAAIVRSAAATLRSPNAYQSPWTGFGPAQSQTNPLSKPQYFFSDDSTLAFLLVRPVSRSDSFLGAHEQVEIMRGIASETRREHPTVDVGLTGMPVLESDEMSASREDTKLSSIVALCGVTLLYLAVFRNWRAPFFTLSILIVGAVWALGWMTITVGHLNLLSATFAVMLIGVADYGVLWVTRYQQEREQGDHGGDAAERIKAALKRTTLYVGPSILTASLTTGLAFFATMLADFQGVAELGWIAGSGVLLCAFSCFTVLPALLLVTGGGWRTKCAGASPILDDPDKTRGKMRQARWIVAAGCCVTVFFGIHATSVRYDQNLLHLQAGELSSVQWQKKLVDHVTGAGWHALAVADNHDEALLKKKALEDLPCVSRVVEVASLIPADQKRKQVQLASIQRKLRSLPAPEAAVNRALPAMDVVRRQVDALNKQSDSPATDRALIKEMSTELFHLQKGLASLSAGESQQRLWLFERKMTRDLVDDLHELRRSSAPRPIGLNDLPTDLRERYVSNNGKWLLRIFSTDSLWDFDHLRDFTKSLAQVDANATGKPFTTVEGLRGLRRGFQWAGFYATIAILLVLALDFRAWLPVLLTLIPLIVGALTSLGLLRLAGIGLNPANVIALPLLVGVGVDNGVHVVHDFLAQRRQPAARYSLSRSTTKGILVAGLTTMLGFGALMLSRHRGLASMGSLLTLGVGCCIAAALILLPAILRLVNRPAPAHV